MHSIGSVSRKEPLDRKEFFKEGLGLLKGCVRDMARGLEEGLEGARAAPSRRFLRPPGALPEPDFLKRCTSCGDCITACHQGAIVPATGAEGAPAGTPVIVPRRQPCFVCNHLICIEACGAGALVLNEVRPVALGRAEVDPAACLAWNGSRPGCNSCWVRCPFPDEAIVIEKRGGPVIRAEACVGCGLCEYACVAEPAAVTVRPA